jgi:hypothetical protein
MIGYYQISPPSTTLIVGDIFGNKIKQNLLTSMSTLFYFNLLYVTQVFS